MPLHEVNKSFTYVLDSSTVSLFIQVNDFCDNLYHVTCLQKVGIKYSPSSVRTYTNLIYMCFTKAFLITIKHQYHYELEKEKSYISQKEKLNEELIFQQSDSLKGKNINSGFSNV